MWIPDEQYQADEEERKRTFASPPDPDAFTSSFRLPPPAPTPLPTVSPVELPPLRSQPGPFAGARATLEAPPLPEPPAPRPYVPEPYVEPEGPPILPPPPVPIARDVLGRPTGTGQDIVSRGLKRFIELYKPGGAEFQNITEGLKGATEWTQEALSAAPLARMLGREQQYENLPLPLKTALDVLPSAVMTAGAAPALSTLPRIGSLLAPVVSSPSFLARLAGEEAVGTAGAVASQETANRIPESAPGVVKVAAPFVAAALTGGLTAGAITQLPRATIATTRFAERNIPGVAELQLAREGVPRIRGAQEIPETPRPVTASTAASPEDYPDMVNAIRAISRPGSELKETTIPGRFSYSGRDVKGNPIYIEGDETYITDRAREIATNNNEALLKKATQIQRQAKQSPAAGAGEAARPPAPSAAEIAPPPAGTVRLYRGEATPGSGQPIPEWIKQGQRQAGITDAQGRWFTDDPERAQWYVNEAGSTGRLTYVDVPQEMADAARVTNNPTAARFSRDPDHEFFVPQDVANQRTVMPPPAATQAAEAAVAHPIEPTAAAGRVVPPVEAGSKLPLSAAPPPRPPEPPTGIGGGKSFEPPLGDALGRLTQAIKSAKAATPEQIAMFQKERAQRTAIGASVLERGQGAEAFQQAKGAMKGEFTRPKFAVPEFSTEDATSLIEAIRTHPQLTFYDKFNAEDALTDLLSGRIPQPKKLETLLRAFRPEPGVETPGSIGVLRKPSTGTEPSGAIPPVGGGATGGGEVPPGGGGIPPGAAPKGTDGAASGKAVDDLLKAVLAKRNLGEKVYSEFLGIVGLPQVLKSSLDVGTRFRQGALLGWSNPKEWMQAWKPTLSSFAKEVNFDQAMSDIRQLKWVTATGDRAGYGFEDVGGHFYGPKVTGSSERPGGFAGLNESYVSRAAQRIPGVRAGERAFAADLNRMGAVVYDKYADAMWNAGVRDIKQYEDLASVINHARGYGDWSPGQLAKGINTFWSARNLTARFQVLLDPILQPGGIFQPSARQLAAKNLVSMVMGDMTLLGAIAGTGALLGLPLSVDFDPRSTDWGKVRIGNTRFDPWGGFAPLARLIAREVIGETKTSTGNVMPTNRQDEVLRFFRNKEAPIPSLITDRLFGPSIPTQPRPGANLQTLVNLFSPFVLQDVVEAAQNTNPFTGVVAGIPSAVGIGVQSYPESSSVTQTKAAALAGLPAPSGLSFIEEYKAYKDNPAVLAATMAKLDQEKRQSPEMGTYHQAQINNRVLRDQAIAGLQARNAAGELSPHDYRKQLQDIIAQEAKNNADARAPIADKLANIEPPQDKEYAAYQAYLGKLYAPGLEDKATGDFDFKAYDQRIKDLAQEYGADKAAAFETRRKADTNPEVQRLTADEDKIKASGYWDLRDQTWQRLHPGGESEDAYNADIRRRTMAALPDSMNTDAKRAAAERNIGALEQRFNSAYADFKRAWLFQHFDTAVALAQNGYLGNKLAEQILMMRDARERQPAGVR